MTENKVHRNGFAFKYRFLKRAVKIFSKNHVMTAGTFANDMGYTYEYGREMIHVLVKLGVIEFKFTERHVKHYTLIRGEGNDNLYIKVRNAFAFSSLDDEDVAEYLGVPLALYEEWLQGNVGVPEDSKEKLEELMLKIKVDANKGLPR